MKVVAQNKCISTVLCIVKEVFRNYGEERDAKEI